MNSWTITGNLGKDVEVKQFDSGKSLSKFSIAVSSGWGDKKTTEWVTVSAWGKLGEACAKFLSKGKKTLVQGELSVRPWTDKQGNNRYSLELNAKEVEFLTPRSEGNDTSPQQFGQDKQQYADPTTPGLDDIPF